jgi:hypothetical protein
MSVLVRSLWIPYSRFVKKLQVVVDLIALTDTLEQQVMIQSNFGFRNYTLLAKAHLILKI